MQETTLVSAADKKHFQDNGYYLRRQFFPRDVAAAAARWVKEQDLRGLAKSWTEQEPGVDLAVLSVIHKEDNPPARLANDKKMLQMGAELIGDDVYIWSSKINMKAAWCGTAEYYHQDFVYWKDRGYPQDSMLSCMVFLEPHHFKNAALCIFPKTHKLGFVEHEPFININGLSKYMIPPRTLDTLSRDFEWENIEAEPGDVLFFHTCLIHGSAHNISPQSRMVLLSQLNAFFNEPQNVLQQAKQFNLQRAQAEVEDAKRRYEWFQRKYEQQLAADDLTFCPPIPDEEKK